MNADMSLSYSEWLHPGCVPEPARINYLRELLSYAMLCPHSSTLAQNSITWASPLHWSRCYEWPWVLHEMDLHFQTRHRLENVLDIGGCWSVLEYAMAKRAGYVECLENDEEALEKGYRSARQLGFGNIKHTYGDARQLPYADCMFDVVTCVSVLEHIPDNHLLCLQEMFRVLRPGGVALITADIKLSGVRRDNSFLNLTNFGYIGLPWPRNEISMQSGLPGDDGQPLTFTVLLSKLVKPL